MVRAVRVGRPRPFWRGALLTLVTLGIYSFYWRYKAHNELYRQFDLEEEGREDGVVWLILALVLGFLTGGLLYFFILVYDGFFVGNVSYLARRLQLPERISPATFILLEIFGGLPFLFGLVFVAFGLVTLSSSAEAAAAPDPPAFVVAAGGFVMLGLLLMVAGIVLLVLPYYRLQRGINEVWAAYDVRMAQLRAPPPPPAASAPAPLPWAPPASPPAPHPMWDPPQRPPDGTRPAAGRGTGGAPAGGTAAG